MQWVKSSFILLKKLADNDFQMEPTALALQMPEHELKFRMHQCQIHLPGNALDHWKNLAKRLKFDSSPMSPHNLFLPILAQSDPQRTTGSGIPINNDANKPVWYFDDMGLVAGIALAIMLALAVVAALIKKQGASNTKGKAFRHIPDARKIDKNSPKYHKTAKNSLK